MHLIDDIFKLSPTATEKTASAPAAPRQPAAAPTGGVSAATQAAVNAALSGGGSDKTASAGTPPPAALEKIAAEVHGFAKTARAQEAHLLGSMVADGFIARLADYEKVAAAQAAQEPSAAPSAAHAKVAEEMFERFIYEQTEGRIQKLAAQHYIEGHRAVEGLFA